MLKLPEAKFDVGVIVVRFQVDELHKAHQELVNFVSSRHNSIIIVLGVSPLPNTRNNPLPFEARRQMIKELYPDANILLVKNHISDETWSKNLDATIKDVLTLQQTACLYGSRDSFISHYSGSFKTIELESDIYVSGSEVRNRIAKDSEFNRDWRKGAIWAAYNRYPVSYQAVDAAIFNEDYSRMLMVRKPGEDKYRFCGGFVDPKTPSLEFNARREVGEELHVEVSDPEYIGSTFINDWRYRGEVDGIITALFACKYIFGTPTPDDDICEARWMDFSEINERTIMPAHIPLVELAKKYHARFWTEEVEQG